MIDWLTGFLAALKPAAWFGGSAAAGIKGAQWLFNLPKGDIPICKTRVVKSGRGLPWNKQLAIHPLKDGRLHLTSLDLPEDQDSN